MNRIITGALLSVALAGAAFAASAPAATSAKPSTPAPAATAAAAPAAPAATMPAPAPTPDYAAQCKSLGEQWTAAADAHKTDKSFAQAKSGATKAERNCKSTKAAAQKKGVSQYEAALKLLGVTTTP
jgi:hypothetical protein